MFQHIVYEVEGPVATITLNRPAQLNAWSALMGKEVREAIRLATADPDVVGIVLTGAGRGFCAGADVSTLAGHVPDGEAPAALPTEADGYEFLVRCPKPIIAAINGPAAGLAVAVVLHCDLRFMADNAIITTAFAQRGLVAEWGIGWLLPRLVGMHKAKELLFFGDDLSAEDAAQLGIVNKVVPPAELQATAKEWAERLALGPTKAIGWTKKLLHDASEVSRRDLLETEAMLVELNTMTEDQGEGVAAFRERRAPEWKGF